MPVFRHLKGPWAYATHNSIISTMKKLLILTLLLVTSSGVRAESDLELEIINLVGKHAKLSKGEFCKAFKSDLSNEQYKIRKYRDIYLHRNFKLEHLSDKNRLDIAAVANDKNGVLQLLNSGEKPSTGLLIWLITYSDTEILASVLKNGIDPDLIENNMQSPLMHAALLGLVDEVKLLLKHGADINNVVSGTSALRNAIMCNHSEVANYLLSKGAIISDADLRAAKNIGVKLSNGANN